MFHSIEKRDIMISLCIIMLFCVSITPVLEADNPEFQETDIESRMISSELQPLFNKGEKFFREYDEKVLQNVEQKSSSLLHSEIVEIRWETSSCEPLIIQMDRTNGQVLFLFDAIKADQQYCGIKTITIDDAFQRAILFMLENELGRPIFEMETWLQKPILEENCWVFTWKHSVLDFEVKNDLIEIWVNRYSGSICSFIQKWSSVKVQEIPEPSIIQINHLLEKNGLQHLSGFVESVSRCYVVPYQQETPGKRAIASYVFRINNNNRSQEICFSVDDGQIIEGTKSLAFGQVEITISADMLGYGTLAGNAAYSRFQSNFYSSVTSTYEATADAIESVWNDSGIEILYHVGHGDLTEGNGFYYLMGSDSEKIYAGEIAEWDLSPHFAFIGTCYSGYYDESKDAYRYLPTVLVDINGAEAFLGFEDEVDIDDIYYFTQIFFNYALNEYEIDTCASIARLLVGGTITGNVVIYGNEDLKLWEYHDNLDTSPGENLGTVTGEDQDAYWNIYNEPLWAPDNDWFHFTISGTHQISIWVIPNEDDFDIIFRLYLPSGGCITVNNGLEGDTEYLCYIQWSGTSNLYRIMTFYTTPYNSGGSYDLSIIITS